ncbi:MAG: cellulose synthase operon protein YhjQ/BcsQ [Solirubrobacteraceae bacterium]
MRVAIVGKGGAGKSVLAGTLARIVARRGTPVLALDSDALPGLSLSLGSGPDPIEPLLLGATERDADGRWGWREGIDATVAIERFTTAAPDGIRLLQRGKVSVAGFGAITGSSKAFWEVAHRLADAAAFRDWALIGDLPGGARQIAEGWAPYADTYLVVAEPTMQSLLTARRVARLASSRPGPAVTLVASKVKNDADLRRIEEFMGARAAAVMPREPAVAEAERLGVALIDHAPDSAAVQAVEGLVAGLEAQGAK